MIWGCISYEEVGTLVLVSVEGNLNTKGIRIF